MGSSKNPEQILIALEPEAAALSCLEKNMSDFKSETGSGSVDSVLSQPNTQYMVVDIGGKFYLLRLSIRSIANLFLKYMPYRPHVQLTSFVFNPLTCSLVTSFKGHGIQNLCKEYVSL